MRYRELRITAGIEFLLAAIAVAAFAAFASPSAAADAILGLWSHHAAPCHEANCRPRASRDARN